jgi:hypothetical protein
MKLTLTSIIDGLLLGDGNLRSDSKISAIYQMNASDPHGDFAELAARLFGQFGFTGKSNRMPGGPRISRGKAFTAKPHTYFRTHAQVELLHHHKRWYHDGIKILPTDIDLAEPITLALWYMGDGNFQWVKGKAYNHGPVARLHTNSFSEGEVDFLQAQLEATHGLCSTKIHWRGQPIISMGGIHSRKFLDLVRPHLVPSFDYKAPSGLWNFKKCVVCNEEITGERGLRNTKYCENHIPKKLQNNMRYQAKNRNKYLESKQARYRRATDAKASLV